MKIGIVGCGLIGKKRAMAIPQGHRLIQVCDIDIQRAKQLAGQYEGVSYTDSYLALVSNPDIDLVVVATLNNLLAPITLAAVQQGKHVIVEKPGALHSSDFLPIMEAIKGTDLCVKVGFNHRYHPAMQKAHEIILHEDVGDIMFIRGRYGHGGRIGYNKEWRSHPDLSGGGETIDQGVHLIDLSRWFMGDFTTIEGFAANYYWDMPVDDNGFLSLRTADGRAAWLQVSCTEWKNMFSFEIYCKRAKLAMEGLGGSYGVEQLRYYKMLPEMGPPDTVIYEYPRGDQSWQLEFEDTISAISEKRPISGDIHDAYEALRIVEKIYERGNQQ